MIRARQILNITRVIQVGKASFVTCRNDYSFKRPLLTSSSLLSSRSYLSSDGGKKVDSDPCQDPLKPHPPSSQPQSPVDSIKLRACRSVHLKLFPHSIYPKPSLKSCDGSNELGTLPQTGGSWQENERKHKQKIRRVLLFGVLFAAASIGAVYYVVMQDAPGKKKQTGKRKGKVEAFKDPQSSQDIPKEVPYLLIGGGTASFTAFRAIKSLDPTAKVLIVTNEAHFPYMRPPLSKEIWFSDDKTVTRNLTFKQWNGSERSLFYEPEDFYISCKDLMNSEHGGVAVARGWTIRHLDVMEKLAYLEDGVTIKYNKCLIATGATPRLNPVFEVALADDNLKNHIKLFRNIDDFKEVFDAFEDAKSIAIVGGGFLGSELACAFGRKDDKKSKEIFQIFRETGNMGKVLPEYLSFWTSDKVRAEGVKVVPKAEVVGVKSKGGKVELMLNSGKALLVDFVVVTTGVEPNTELAEKSDLEVDPELGGYLVNTELQARTDVYVAGDSACFYDSRLGRRRIEHHDHAVVSGRLAGENMAGARNAYSHQSMFWSDLGPEVGYEAIGIVDSSLPTVAVFAKQSEKDTPLAILEQTGEGDRSKTEELPQECEKYLSDEEKQKLIESKRLLPNATNGEDYAKGVIFYLRDDVVVGIVLWNVFNRMSIARQVLKDQKKYDDLNEVAKLFNIHGEE